MKLSVNFQECDDSMGFNFEEKTESFNIGFGDNSNGSSIDNEKVNAIEKKVDSLEEKVLEVDESVKTAMEKAENAEKTANESKFTTDDTLTLKDGILSVNTDVVGGGGSGSGGVTSWDDLKNKPFGEFPPVFDITWDGNMEGHEVVDEGEGAYSVKVSDEVFTKEQLLNSIVFVSNSNEIVDTIVNTEENIYVDEEFGAIFLDCGMVIFSAENFNSAAGLPEGTFSNGVWFNNRTGENPYYVNRLVAAPTIKTIDEKYIPDTIATKEDVAEAIANTDIEVSWNDITDKPFGEDLGWARQESLTFKQVTTNGNITKGIWQNVSVNLVEGQRYKIVVIDSMNNKVLYEWDNVAIRDTTGTGSTTVNGESSDVYFSYNIIFKMTNLSYVGEKPSSALVSVVIYNESPAIKPLDEKYIPDTIARVSDVPTSYNDLTDVPVKETITTVFPEQSVTITVNSTHIATQSIDTSLNLIVFDGQEYLVNGISYSAFRVYGNGSLLSSTLVDNGMPFALAYDYLNHSLYLYANAGTHTISAYKRELVFLNEKFLPDVVVLESELEAKGYQNEEQVKALINNALGEIENGTY